MIQLSKRLQAVADLLVQETKKREILCVADVGTDHGYIPIYLVEQEICKSAIAMDINKGPLQRAKEHIELHGLGDYIQTRLSDGLAALNREEVSAIVIAGMGGATMSNILEAGKAVITEDTLLILQPQSELMEFRTYLQENHFEILQEDMVQEDGKYYPMMKVRKFSKDMACKSYSANELLYGPLLLQEKHPILKEFLLWQLSQKEKILVQLEKNAGEGTKEKRVREVEAELEGIKQTLEVVTSRL